MSAYSDWIAFLQECRDRGVKVILDDHIYDLDKSADWEALASHGNELQLQARMAEVDRG